MVGPVKRAVPTNVSRTCLRTNFDTLGFNMHGNRESEILGTVCVLVAVMRNYHSAAVANRGDAMQADGMW